MTDNITTEMKFIRSPARDIWGIVTCPLPKMTAFGPVPEGSMKAQEQAKVAGIISRKGWVCPAVAIVASTGKKMLALPYWS